MYSSCVICNIIPDCDVALFFHTSRNKKIISETVSQNLDDRFQYKRSWSVDDQMKTVNAKMGFNFLTFWKSQFSAISNAMTLAILVSFFLQLIKAKFLLFFFT